MNETVIDSLTRRLEQLEARNDSLAAKLDQAERRERRVRRASAGAFVLLAGALVFAGRSVTAQDANVQDTVRAHTFLALDSDGNVRGILSGEKGKVGMALLDKAGKARIAMTEKGGTPILSIADKDGNVRFVAGVLDSGAAAIQIDDKDGNPVFKKP